MHPGRHNRPSAFWPLLVMFACPGVLFSRLPSAHALPPAASPTAPLDALVQQGEALQNKVIQLELRLSQANVAQAARQRRASQAAQEIERLKNQPPGVGRDLALGDRLAQAQARAGEMAKEEEAYRALAEELRTARRQLLVASDRILDADQQRGAGLTAAQRFGWLRLRTAQVEALLGEGNASSARALAKSEMAADGATAGAALDDPQVLRERADLLRDSADKLRREVERLQARGEELQRRQRLRERASRVDEDLFAEQSTARRSTGSAASRAGGATMYTDAPAPPLGGPNSVMPPAVSGSAAGTATHNGPDPSTLDGLLRVEGPGDPATKLQALAHAQAELQTLASDLQRRASRLDQRAASLSHQK